ncbi:protein no-on-transient A-like [Paramacrobiotus metropolitanus]|uniref:protein no-on-transient A-like n=1 Tax=Paramacrobiotus metropolitanus TaxID=2943436 RepID=UPI002446028E|nr:protein no-on-transient A-like [Paramacrobiotus metropolitanus]
MIIDVASAGKGPAKIWFDGESDFEDAEAETYTIMEWMAKFKDEFGDRDEEVIGLREAMARKFKPGKGTLDQFYQAIMKFKAKKAITELQAVAFLIDGCGGDNDLYKALKTKGFRTPTEIKDFFRSWAAGEGAQQQQGSPNNGNFNGGGDGNTNWNNGQRNGNFNQNRNQGNYQQNRGSYQPQQGSRKEWRFGQIDGWVAQGVQLCQHCLFGNLQTQSCMLANMPLNRNPNLFASREWQRLRNEGGWRQALANGYDMVAHWAQFKQQNGGGGGQGNGQGSGYNGGGRGGFRGRGRGRGRGGYGNWNGGGWRANNNGGGGNQNNGGGANGAGQGQQNVKVPKLQELNQGNGQDQ